MPAILCYPWPGTTRTCFIPAGCIWPIGPPILPPILPMEGAYMSSLINVQPTSISPPFDPRLAAEKGLVGSAVSRASLTERERDRMYALLETYFKRNNRAQYEADLAEKEAVILLRDESSGKIQGFS